MPVAFGATLLYDLNSQLQAWDLKIESVDIQINRQVSVIPLPLLTSSSDIFTNRPVAWCLDLGMMSETVILHGVSEDNDGDVTNPQANPVPTITQLAEIVRCVSGNKHTSVSSGSLIFGNAVTLSLFAGDGQASPIGSTPVAGSTESFVGVIQSFARHRNGGDTYWSWTLTHASVSWAHAQFLPF